MIDCKNMTSKNNPYNEESSIIDTINNTAQDIITLVFIIVFFVFALGAG